MLTLLGIQKLSGGTEDSVAIVLRGKEYTPEQISAEITPSTQKRCRYEIR